jgi:hypothetical protein
MFFSHVAQTFFLPENPIGSGGGGGALNCTRPVRIRRIVTAQSLHCVSDENRVSFFVFPQSLHVRTSGRGSGSRAAIFFLRFFCGFGGAGAWTRVTRWAYRAANRATASGLISAFDI